MNELFYKSANYIIKEPLLMNACITAYDISKANINVLFAYDKITEPEYYKLYTLDKKSREIAIGRKISSAFPSLAPLSEEEVDYKTELIKTIQTGISEAKRLLIQMNDIKEEEIVRIANDAVYINRPVPLNFTTFDLNKNGRPITFIDKGQYNILLNLNKVSLFINDNPLSEQFEIDVIGINNDNLDKHRLFISFIIEMLSSLQKGNKELVLSTFNSFYNDYLNMNLPVDYYREFNADSGYRILNAGYIIDDISELEKNKINIEYNLSLLRQLYSIIMEY